jgi:hypothetical protein
VKPYEVPIDVPYRPLVEALVRQLAAGRLEELVRSGQMASHATEPTAALILSTGRKLVPLPHGWWEDTDAIMFPVHEPDEWCALLPLRTEDGGRGPLWLEIELYLDVSGIRAEIEHVFLRPSATV